MFPTALTDLLHISGAVFPNPSQQQVERWHVMAMLSFPSPAASTHERQPESRYPCSQHVHNLLVFSLPRNVNERISTRQEARGMDVVGWTCPDGEIRY
jgi:hypothetical protein